MLFAETDSSLNALYMGLLALVVVVTQLLREWRDTARAKNVARRAEEVKTALIASERSVSGKLAEVKTSLTKKSEESAETRQDIREVKDTLQHNTALTAETNLTVKGGKADRDKILSHVNALQDRMEEHGIQCPPHIEGERPDESPPREAP